MLRLRTFRGNGASSPTCFSELPLFFFPAFSSSSSSKSLSRSSSSSSSSSSSDPSPESPSSSPRSSSPSSSSSSPFSPPPVPSARLKSEMRSARRPLLSSMYLQREEQHQDTHSSGFVQLAEETQVAFTLHLHHITLNSFGIN